MDSKLVRFCVYARDGFSIAILLMFIVTFCVDFEAIYYSKTQPEDCVSGRTGYPAADRVPVLESMEDILKYRYAFTMEVDAEKMQPLGVYFGLESRTITKFRFPKFLEGHDELVHGQFYFVELDSGDKVCILLDDYLLQLPKKGRVKLPRGDKYRTGSITKRNLVEKTGMPEEGFEYYIDMATDWRKGREARDCYAVRHTVDAALFFGVTLTYILIAWIVHGVRERKVTGKGSSIRQQGRALRKKDDVIS